jgi:hypothetical protein
LAEAFTNLRNGKHKSIVDTETCLIRLFGLLSILNND